MKVFLDDNRPCPPGWVLVRWPDEAIELLKTGQVTEISLDHDLGDDERGTGNDVVNWIEEQVALHDFVPPRMQVHSDNWAKRPIMEAGIRSIKQLHARNQVKR